METDYNLKEALYSRFIVPTIGKTDDYIGVETELPVVDLSGKAVDYGAVHRMTGDFIEHFGFDGVVRDDDGNIYFAENKRTGDNISFDCSYNTFEIAFGKETDLNDIAERFYAYYGFADGHLRRSGHALTGMGINPGYRVNSREPVANGRYRMLLHHLDSYKRYGKGFSFHDVPYYGLIACSTQTHIDVSFDDLADTMHMFERLEPFKGLLFANSPFDGGYLCVRDHFWRNSTHGINPRNVDFWGEEIQTAGDIVDYLSGMSLFCAERDGKYMHFVPLTLDEYFRQSTVTGEYHEDGQWKTADFVPRSTDLKYLRSYKLVDLTFRGTLELRSACTQPIYQVMSVPAFNIGIRDNRDAVKQVLDESGLFEQGYTLDELRRMSVMREVPGFMQGEQVSGTLMKLLEAARDGLLLRGKGEEKFLEPLYERAERVLSPARELVEGLEKGKTFKQYIDLYGYAGVR